MKKLIILDTETTGLKPEQGHRLIEICAMEVMNGIKTGKIFHNYVNPLRSVPDEAFAIHGISTEFLQDKKVFSELAPSFLEFISDSTLVIHNARFDLSFLNFELIMHGHKPISFDNVVDTLILARKKFPGSPASLDALCKRFKISLANRDKHGALIDVELLFEVYRCLVDDHLLIKSTTNLVENISNRADNLILREKEFKSSRNYSLSSEELEEHKKFLKSIKNPIWENI